jgi:hypothetical protein
MVECFEVAAPDIGGGHNLVELLPGFKLGDGSGVVLGERSMMVVAVVGEHGWDHTHGWQVNDAEIGRRIGREA